MRWLACGCFAVVMLLGADASAQNIYTSRSGLYSFQVPAGWSVVRERQNEDVVIAPPGGIGRGSIYVIFGRPRGSLDDDATYTFGGSNVTVNVRQMRTLDRFSCLHIASTSGRGVPHNNIWCHFTVPYRDGPVRQGFMIGQAKHPDVASSQEAIFQDVLNSLKFHPALQP